MRLVSQVGSYLAHAAGLCPEEDIVLRLGLRSIILKAMRRRLRPSTAVDKNVFQCTKFWIEKEAPMWVVEVVSSGETRENWGVLDFFVLVLFGHTQKPILRKSFLFVRFLRGVTSFLYLRPDTSSGAAPLLESAPRSKNTWCYAYAPQDGFELFCRRPF